MRVGHAAQRVAAAVVLVITMGVAQSQPMPNVASDDAPERRSFAIVDVTTFDGVAFRWDQDVWIDNGRIRAVGQALELPGNLLRIDGRGRTLMPGLIDSHVHAFGTALHDALRFGVTSVLDQGNEPTAADSKRAARETLAPGDEADFFTAGMLATATGGHGTHVDMAVEPVRGHAEAESWVQARKAEGSDWIKIVYEDGLAYGPAIPTLDRETIRALIAAAHAEDLLAVMHVSTLDHALEAVELGANGLVHVWGDALLDDVQAARIAEAGVFVVPTLTVIAARGSRYSAMSDAAIENVRRLHAAGVSLLAGTDAPNVGTAFGVSLHGELKLLVRAGLSNAEALAAATSLPATAFGIEDRGRIEVGQIADLVLVEGDLERDVSASTRIIVIWKDGYRLDHSSHEETSVATPASETTLISDFDGGIGSSFGLGWQVTTDQVRGGLSTAELSTLEGTLRVTGEVVAGDAAFAFPWSGAIYFPGPQPMQPIDFSDREVLRFRARGDGRMYVVMLFDGSGTRPPPALPFTAPAVWTDIEIPLARFPTATPGTIGGLAFVATMVPGTYAFELDDVEIE